MANEFKWLNESDADLSDEKIIIKAPAQSDFFCGNGIVASNGVLPQTLCNAPFYYTNITGDFVIRVQVSHDFKDVYDACTLMLMQSDEIWGKLCFEKTDFGTNAVVSVVTNGISDDANGCNVDVHKIWLQITRSGNAFAFHYSLDGVKFDMVRFFCLPVNETIKVGLVAQAPIGSGGERIFENITIENKTVINIREGK